MGGQIARLLRHSVVYGLVETISRGTGFVLMFLYLRVFTDAEIGDRTLFFTASALVGMFTTLGLDSAFLRYFMDTDLADRRREVVSSAFWYSLVLSIGWCIPSFLAGRELTYLIADTTQYVSITRLIFIIMVFDALGVFPTLILRAEHRFVYYGAIGLARFALFILANLLFVVVLKRGVQGVFEANLVVVVILFCISLPIYRPWLGMVIAPDLVGRMLRFGIPTIFTVVGTRIIDVSDRRIIKALMDSDAVGQYTAAYTIGMVGTLLFVNSFRVAWQPFFLSHKDDSSFSRLAARVATYYAMTIGWIVAGISLFRREVFSFYAPEMSKASPALSDIIPLVALSYLFYGFYLIMLPGVYFKERTAVLTTASLTGAAINVALNFVFIPRFGLMGAAVATLVAYMVMGAILYGVSNHIYRIGYEWTRIVVSLLICSAPVAIDAFWRPSGYMIGLTYHSVLALIPPISLLSCGILSPKKVARFLTLCGVLHHVRHET